MLRVIIFLAIASFTWGSDLLPSGDTCSCECNRLILSGQNKAASATPSFFFEGALAGVTLGPLGWGAAYLGAKTSVPKNWRKFNENECYMNGYLKQYRREASNTALSGAVFGTAIVAVVTTFLVIANN